MISGQLAFTGELTCLLRLRKFRYRQARGSNPNFMFPIIRTAVFLITASLLFGLQSAGADQMARPHVLGISHMALFVRDLAKSRAFYEDFLGYAEPYKLKRDDGTDR